MALLVAEPVGGGQGVGDDLHEAGWIFALWA